MTSPQEPRTIRGVVLSEAGHPVSDVIVGVMSGPIPLPDIAAVTGDDGDFILAAPALGQYVVTVTYPDGAQVSRTLHVADEDTEVALVIRPGDSGES